MNSTAQSTAQKIARQLAQEPIEILKSAREQVTGETQENTNSQNTDNLSEAKNENLKLQNEIKSQRLLSALNSELRDIKRQNLFKDLQQKIASGEEVYLEDENELTIEQKEVLKAQIEAVAKQKSLSQISQPSSLFGSSKPSRKMGGQKQQAQKEQTRVEKPVPPSG